MQTNLHRTLMQMQYELPSLWTRSGVSISIQMIDVNEYIRKWIFMYQMSPIK